jgi:hypothetical protein
VPALQIPPDHQRGLLRLLSLPTEQAADFLKSIESAAKRVRSDKLSSADLQGTSGISSEDLDNMLDTILALYHVRHHADVSAEEFISDVIDSLREDKKASFVETEKIPAIRERLAAFLNIDRLNLWAKASVLRYEHERSLHDLRILTDARPVFGEEASAQPQMAVIFHMLKIEYHAAKGIEEVYFSLDEDDLEYLKRAIIRAETKARSLREALAKGHITTINPS